ncbi:NACHT domain-domain-containing protein [Microdochium bolleyi]|uniref:NACHT domain-domain-containing protein n=1 Tax=Microdochium bolleyi TaxID=196109 RepID=A0A136IIF5_9PEZI|nr:NACHT domain-domain-containing protein [Microdochium bolleyi]
MATDVGRPQSPAGLVQVFVGARSADTETDIDIIAIHGLDTRSPDTWTWRDRGQSSGPVNWLQDSAMLPSIVGRARIFTCDWPAQMLQKSIPTTLEESAEFLLQTLNQHLEQNTQAGKDRPVFFIASCLGGIILIKALELSDSPPLVTATRGIVFLATPFLGTAFKDIPYLSLKAWGSFNDQSVSALMDYTREPTPGLDELVCGFLDLQKEKHYHVFAFWESHETSLLGKIHLAWLFSCRAFLVCRIFLVSSLLVNESSARAQILERQRLNRSHVLMNKFRDPGCADYKQVASKIEEIVRKIREGTLLKQADAWICDKCYTTKRLEISRLSGKPLPLDRRILIRGRAGVGKTTLCKKIVHEFKRGTWAEWAQLFDRILWVPLRNLKLEGRRCQPAYDFTCLFHHEYFTLPNSRTDLAKELSRALEMKNSRTLFLLDGLDEVSQDLTGDGSMSRFLEELLKQPNVIITSRPSANTPPHLDLELETVGFHPDQVEAYVERAFTAPVTGKVDLNKTKEVLSFLKGHWLIEGLVRIPIQLDALCYTWDDFDPESVPNTMTGMYEAIEQKLWKKDVVRLQKMSEYNAMKDRPAEVQQRVGNELRVLECLAFNAHRDAIVDIFPPSTLPLDETLEQLSFLRTSDSSAKLKDREYHFIHLTFQEYFAARYFVRQWKEDKQLEYRFKPQKYAAPTDPASFLRTHKYIARYDVLWRFVTGLLNSEKDDETLRFFNILEEPPLDLLGPAHQRLVMHCLGEVSDDLEIREHLETRLSEWLLFECRFTGETKLASEVEFPEKALIMAIAARLEDEHWYVRRAAIKALRAQSALPTETATAIAARLEHEDQDVRRAAIKTLGAQSALPTEMVTAIAARLEDEDQSVRQAAIEVLQEQSALPTETATAIAARLDDDNSGKADLRRRRRRRLPGSRHGCPVAGSESESESASA